MHHIELTISDLKKSTDFYSKLPGFKIVARHPNFIMFFNGNFYLGLTDHKDNLKEDKFDETNVGLDHVSFLVKNRQDLDEAVRFFNREEIEHGEIKKLSNNLYVLAFRDPDNIQLELCWKQQVS